MRRDSRPTVADNTSPAYRATGEVVDGDTIRLAPANGASPANARIFGYDAWESDQLGFRPGIDPLPIGQHSTDALNALIAPETAIFGVGKQSYGRQVVGLGPGATDPVNSLLLGGHGLAAPSYLADDPERRAVYLESERLGRLNRQGAHAAQYLAPDVHRKASRWNLKIRPGEEAVFTSELPELRPEFQRLSEEEERDFFGFLASKSGDPNFSQADLDAYWRGKGREASEAADPEFIEAIRSGQRFGNIDYSAWDAQTLRDFKMANSFAGLRPDVREAYDAVLNDPEANADTLQQFADVNGLTFDPRDVAAFFAARARGENPNVPIPIINPGDGASGAGARGFADPFGALDEMGGAVDAVAPAWLQSAFGGPTNRETVWNSDRGFGDIYENNTRQNRAIIDYDETHHPFARAGGQIASGFLLPYGGGVRGASNLAKIGAAEGAAYGFGSGDGTLGQRLANMPLNAAGGAFMGGAIGKTIDVLAPSVRTGIARLRGEAPTPDIPAPPPGFEIEGPSISRADMAADTDPALIGPRVRDTIDVNAARPRLLSEGPSPDLMRAATARVEPGDVLPRPANEVTADDAARLAVGGYKPVKAPRERDYLETRYFPSRSNPDNLLPRKGPLDLVGFVRAQGGVADWHGELRHAGISNDPRAMDFAQAEKRLGNLVDDIEGSTLDDMALRAWEAGYFPDHYQRPTVDEFVTALAETQRGINRRFHPDDLAEVEAFEGARQTRWDVERAEQEGSPLVADTAQPATLDDMIANTPPATAYDDWNNAVVSKVGNIRVDKLDSPQDIGQALKVADNVAGGFDAARRGTISHAETQALAQDLGMTADDLLARRKGQAFSAEEAYAARAILAKSGNELVNVAKRIRSLGDDPGSEALAMFRKALVRHAAIQEQVAGMTAEAGRALSAFRMAADSRDIPGRVLEGLVNAGGGPDRLKDAAEAIITLERDAASLNKFIEKASKPKFSDKLVEVWYNFLLSGPQTHMVNVLSNTMTSLAQLPEHAVAAGVGSMRRAFNREAIDRVPVSEVGARAIGLLQGTREGMREFARAFRTGEPVDFVTKVENQGQKAISGLKGEVLRVPTRLLTAEDELFKAMARRMEIAGLASRQARKEGLKGREARNRIAELVGNPTDEMMISALDYGRYVTFQRPLGEVASKVSAMTNAAPILKAVLPFVRTPTNLFKFAVERSPAAPLLREWRQDYAAGGARRDLAVARSMVGSGMGALFAESAAQGLITGSAPPDDNRRRLMMADGWQPYSVKIGDRYYSYQRLDPFALTIGAAADMATLGDGMTENQKSEGAALVVASIIGNLSNKTWLSGVSDVLAALDDPQRFGDSFVKRFAGSATVPTGVAQVARTIDPTMREAPDSLTTIQSRIPGLSDDLLPKRDVWGRPIEKEGGLGPDILSPIWTSTQQGDPATHEALRVGATISPPSNRVNGEKLPPEQYDRLQAVTGPLAHKWVSELIKLPEYRALDLDGQAKAIKYVMEKAREVGKANVLSGVPIPTSRPVKGERRKAQRQRLAPPPPGFVVDPLPTGFLLD